MWYLLVPCAHHKDDGVIVVDISAAVVATGPFLAVADIQVDRESSVPDVGVSSSNAGHFESMAI